MIEHPNFGPKKVEIIKSGSVFRICRGIKKNKSGRKIGNITVELDIYIWGKFQMGKYSKDLHGLFAKKRADMFLWRIFGGLEVFSRGVLLLARQPCKSTGRGVHQSFRCSSPWLQRHQSTSLTKAPASASPKHLSHQNTGFSFTEAPTQSQASRLLELSHRTTSTVFRGFA